MDQDGCGEPADVSGNDAEISSLWRTYQSGGTAVEWVAVSTLRLGDTPRTGGVSEEHVHALAKIETRLPPILVHRPTMRVIDGVHRLRAAELCEHRRIAAQFFDGDIDDAFVLAVEANTVNGLPLTLADRKAAAARIILTHPTRSDRWIALVSGLAATTVGAIRRCSTVSDRRSNTRVGRDGRLRPLDSSEGRRLAGELIRADPNRSLRDIARTVGIAPSTVLDVRNRLSSGEDPVPARRDSTVKAARLDDGHRPARRAIPGQADSAPDPLTILNTLRKDPSLRFSESGRTLLRWLDVHTISGPAVPAVQDIPAHCVGTIAALARHNARFWLTLSEHLDELDRDDWPAAQAH